MTDLSRRQVNVHRRAVWVLKQNCWINIPVFFAPSSTGERCLLGDMWEEHTFVCGGGRKTIACVFFYFLLKDNLRLYFFLYAFLHCVSRSDYANICACPHMCACVFACRQASGLNRGFCTRYVGHAEEDVSRGQKLAAGREGRSPTVHLEVQTSGAASTHC